MNIRAKIILVSISLAIALYSCGTSPSSFYLLTPMEGYDKKVSNTNDNIGVGIGSLELPDYLMKPQIATYTSQSEISFDEYNRWAEPLDESFTRVLIENLSQMIPTNSIYLFMWPEEKQDIFQVNIKVDQFGLLSDSTVVLHSRWSVSSTNIKSYWLSEKANYQHKISEINYANISTTMSHLIADLSKDIANEIKRKNSME